MKGNYWVLLRKKAQIQHDFAKFGLSFLFPFLDTENHPQHAGNDPWALPNDDLHMQTPTFPKIKGTAGHLWQTVLFALFYLTQQPLFV